VRNGTSGPEAGKAIHIGEDCWLGGNVIVLPGVTIGRGTTIGAGSVVSKDIPEFVVAVGNPAKVVKKLDVKEPADWPHKDGGAPVKADGAKDGKFEILAGERIAETS
jgi:serine acetyltransferase